MCIGRREKGLTVNEWRAIPTFTKQDNGQRTFLQRRYLNDYISHRKCSSLPIREIQIKPIMREIQIKPTNQTTISTSMAGTKKDK